MNFLRYREARAYVLYAPTNRSELARATQRAGTDGVAVVYPLQIPVQIVTGQGAVLVERIGAKQFRSSISVDRSDFPEAGVIPTGARPRAERMIVDRADTETEGVADVERKHRPDCIVILV